MNDVVLEAFEAAGAEGGVVYVTMPITSGRREFALLKELDCTREELRSRHRDRWLDEVVRVNEREAQQFVQLARARFAGHLVVDPSRLHVADWTQDDFDKLWTVLIERYAKVIVVSPQWAFSRGARLEVALAVSLGIETTDPFGEVLSRADLAAMLAAAESELREMGWSAERLRTMLPDVPVDAPGPVAPRAEAARFEPAAAHTFSWLMAERRYQVRKFGTELDDEHTRQGLGEDGWWWRQLTNYFGRANVLGLESPNGRQAVAKFVATACGLLESVVRVHGELPAPGVPSGDIRKPRPE